MHFIEFELVNGKKCWINAELISTIEEIKYKGTPAVRIIMANGREMEVNVPTSDEVVSKIWSFK